MALYLYQESVPCDSKVTHSWQLKGWHILEHLAFVLIQVQCPAALLIWSPQATFSASCCCFHQTDNFNKIWELKKHITQCTCSCSFSWRLKVTSQCLLMVIYSSCKKLHLVWTWTITITDEMQPDVPRGIFAPWNNWDGPRNKWFNLLGSSLFVCAESLFESIIWNL